MKQVIYASVAALLALAPGAVALADTAQANVGLEARTQLMRDSMHTIASVHLDGDDGDADDISASSSARWGGRYASTTPYMRGEKEGIEKHYGTTTPPGIARHEGIASSTEVKNDLRLGFTGFFNWLFSHPASTTVADLKQEIASSSASTSVKVSGNFFNSFFGVFAGWFHR